MPLASSSQRACHLHYKTDERHALQRSETPIVPRAWSSARGAVCPGKRAGPWINACSFYPAAKRGDISLGRGCDPGVSPSAEYRWIQSAKAYPIASVRETWPGVHRPGPLSQGHYPVAAIRGTPQTRSGCPKHNRTRHRPHRTHCPMRRSLHTCEHCGAFVRATTDQAEPG